MPATHPISGSSFRVYLGKLSTDGWYRISIADAVTGLGVAGKVYSDITVQYAAAGAVGWTAYSVATADFKEIGLGQYWLNIGATEFTNTSHIQYAVNIACASCYDDNFTVDAHIGLFDDDFTTVQKSSITTASDAAITGNTTIKNIYSDAVKSVNNGGYDTPV